MSPLKRNRSTLDLAVFCSLAGLFIVSAAALLAPVAAAQSEAAIALELVWRADTSAHPITNGGSIAVDGGGNLYVTDYGADGRSYQIHKYDQDGRYLTSWGTTGGGPGEFAWRPASPEEGPDAGFLATDEAGNVYVSDGYNFRVQKFDGSGRFLLEWGAQGDADGQFAPPTVGPIAIDTQGVVFVSDFTQVQRFDGSGRFLSKFGRFGSNEGEFQGAAQVGWDSQGNHYVADLLNARFQKFDAADDFLLAVGAAGDADGEFLMPLQVVVDSRDRLFVTDNSHRLQAFDTDGNFLAVWTEPGNGDGPFELAGSVAIDGEDNLYLAVYREADGYALYKFRQK